jgi:anti-sigma factor RsiW
LPWRRPRKLDRVTVPDTDDLPCQELVELATEYLEDRLPPSTRLRFEAHLAQCSGCRTYLEQMRQTIRGLGRLPAESMAPETRDRLLAAFRDWKRPSA